MTYQTERENFIARIVKELPDTFSVGEATNAARLILRHANTYARLAVESCNGHPWQSQTPFGWATMTDEAKREYNAKLSKAQDRWDARIERDEKRIEKRITEICAPLGLTPRFGGDPRGYTVSLHLPSGAYNSWGGAENGYGVPTRDY